MRTNIEIDDKLMRQAMKATQTTTKKGTVEACLREVVQLRKQGRIRALRGKVVWRGPDDDWFASDEETLKKQRGSEDNTEPESAHIRAAEQPVLVAEVC
jgi:Arc/MetJ family transcription regulator